MHMTRRALRTLLLPLVCILLVPAFVLAQPKGAKPKSGLSKVLRTYEQHALRNPGDPSNGKKLFETSQRIKCATCHKVASKGGEVGPDLSSIGGKFDRSHLIESLLEPSRQIVEGYRSTIIQTDAGKVLSGVVKTQDEKQITLIDANGKTHTIARVEIEESLESPVSIMPEGLAKELSVSEFTDLIAYLESLRHGDLGTWNEVTGPISVPPGFEIHTIATGLNGVTALEVLPDGRVLVCEQTGSVRIVENGKLLEKPVLTLPVDEYWERGVIGITFDPEFSHKPYIYVCWIAKEPYPHHRISRFTLKGNVALPGSEKLLLSGDDQTKMGGTVPAGHQGGALHFGKDGKLYIAIGEQTAKMPAQKIDTFLGKILRINRDGSIPKDNPFVNEAKGKYRAIWARGARNPFTFAVRSSDGLLLINDVGDNHGEEINVGRAGANYGWPMVAHGNQPAYKSDKFDGPIHWYPRSSVNGADFCEKASNWPRKMHERFFFADYVHGWIKSINPDNNPREATTFGTGFRRPVDLRFAPDGSLYLLVRNAWVIDDKFEGGTGALMQISYQKKGLRRKKKQAVKIDSPSVLLTENSTDPSAGGLPAFKIETPSATYYLEKTGGGLSSLVDRDGNDWLGFHPEEGSGAGGEYRGFPNAVHRQGGSSYFHAKNAGTSPVNTSVERVEDHFVSILAESKDGKWQARYDFLPTHCTFTITKMPKDKKHWILYEGTPGGEMELDDWWMTSAISTPQSMIYLHDQDIPSPEWIAFGDDGGKRSIVLFHHEDDNDPDFFYQMHRKMTVFGFGRKRLEAFFSNAGHRFSIGLVESSSHKAISAFVGDIAKQSGAKSDAILVTAAVPKKPLSIDVWYGLQQRFGHNGNPQKWVNVLGCLKGYSKATTLEYTLNGGKKQKLTIGSNYTRLANPGDFNVEIDHKDLTKGENSIVLFATDGAKNTSVTVTLDYAASKPSPLPLYIDWSKAEKIQDVAQVVDGLWKLTPKGLRVVEPYYDRVVAFGDESWTDYEVTVPVTFHGIRKPGPNDGGPNVIHAAIAVRWPGHADGPKPTQPRTIWYPLGATAEFTIQNHPKACSWRILGDRRAKAFEKKTRQIEFEKQYIMKHRVETVGKKAIYNVKLWNAEKKEPTDWDVTFEEKVDIPRGGALLLAHYTDVTFGNVTVTPCKKTQPNSLEGRSSLLIPTKKRGAMVLAGYSVPQESAPQKLGPKPGDVYREYVIHNGGENWRVTAPNAKAEGAQEFLPNPVLSLDVHDLEGAVRAEAVLDRWGGHPGTKQKMIRFNANDWITLPELTTTPESYERYYSQDNPVVAVPLEHLKLGENILEGTIGPENDTGWGQWGLYSLILRVYYDPEKKEYSTGRITSPNAGETLTENPTIQLQCDANAERIDILAWYDGYDEDGNGVFNEWHATRFQPFRGQAADLECHVGTIDPSLAERDLTWKTRWIPDQKPNAIQLIARVQNNSGLTYVTDIVEGLSLKREGWSVKQYRATDVPERFGVRIGQKKFCNIPIAAETDLSRATQAVLHYRTWSGHNSPHEPFQLNGHEHQNEGKSHHYDYDLLPIPIAEIKTGNNRFAIHSNNEHHMLEVLWPGPAITVRFKTDE